MTHGLRDHDRPLKVGPKPSGTRAGRIVVAPPPRRDQPFRRFCEWSLFHFVGFFGSEPPPRLLLTSSRFIPSFGRLSSGSTSRCHQCTALIFVFFNHEVSKTRAHPLTLFKSTPKKSSSSSFHYPDAYEFCCPGREKRLSGCGLHGETGGKHSPPRSSV